MQRADAHPYPVLEFVRLVSPGHTSNHTSVRDGWPLFSPGRSLAITEGVRTDWSTLPRRGLTRKHLRETPAGSPCHGAGSRASTWKK